MFIKRNAIQQRTEPKLQASSYRKVPNDIIHIKFNNCGIILKILKIHKCVVKAYRADTIDTHQIEICGHFCREKKKSQSDWS